MLDSMLRLATKIWPAVMLLLVLGLYNGFAYYRIQPEVCRSKAYTSHAAGDLDRTVFRVFRQAKKNAEKPFWSTSGHVIYLGRNPALFQLVSELFIRAGAKTPLPNQVFTLTLFNLGIILGAFWQRLFFRDWVIPILCGVFLVLTKFLLVYSPTIHSYAYWFFFFNLAVLAFLLYLKRGRTGWLVLTLAAYFGVCLNYWMFYVSTFLVLVGLHYVHRDRIVSKATLLVAAIPVLGFLTTVYMVARCQGGLGQGLFHLSDILAARTLDARVPGAEWNPDSTFVSWVDLFLYPTLISKRVATFFHFGWETYVIMLGAGYLLAEDRRKRRYRFLWFLLAAGFSWHVLMVQHNVVHGFTAIYSYFLWMLSFAIFCRETVGYVWRSRATPGGRSVVLVLLLPVAVRFFYSGAVLSYYEPLRHDMAVAAGEHAPDTLSQRAKKAKESQRGEDRKPRKKKNRRSRKTL